MAYPISDNATRFSHLQPDGSEVVYERTGGCCRCGECCVGDPFNGDEGPPAIEGFCPLLQLVGDQLSCSNREHPYYLSGCVEWPTHPGQIEDKPSCTYEFRLAE